jgi:hypothetical protein
MYIAATLIWVVPAVTAAAQTTQQQQAQAHKARVELWTGIVFASVGAWIAPVTSAGDSRPAPVAVFGGVGLIGVGGTLIYRGIRDWPQAQRPSRNLGVMIGPKIGVLVRRRW